MKKRSLLPTEHTYASMFGACAEAGRKSTEILKKLREEIERRNVVLDIIPTNALLAALAACGLHDDVRDVYDNMIKRNMVSDIMTFTSLLLATTHYKEAGFEAAQRVWSEMTMSPDLHCFNVLLRCIRDCSISSLEGVGEGKRTVILKLDQVKSTKLHMSGVASFSLGDGGKLKVHVGYVVRKGRVKGPAIRWLETEDVEVLLSYLEKLQLQPDIRLFHLLAQLTLDLSFLMGELTKLEGKVFPDNKFVVAAIKKQAHIGNLTGAKVHYLCVYFDQ